MYLLIFFEIESLIPNSSSKELTTHSLTLLYRREEKVEIEQQILMP
jgi:hypothetical protein